MYDLSCPSCNSPSQFDFRDYLLMCPFCSATFRLDVESGHKEVFSDHYIIANGASPGQVKELVTEWLKRLHHRPAQTEKEYFVTDINGLSIPFWVVSMEVHTVWKGLVKRKNRPRLDNKPGADYLVEKGQFRRNYRWAISARNNLCESWGMTRLHEPKEPVDVEWDGYPLDSTLSRGQVLESDVERNAYDSREFFEFKFANGLHILGIQVSEEEALRRARMHVDQYHLELARRDVDYLLDYRNEAEIAGVQLVHIPFWHAKYVYRPQKLLKYFIKPKEKNVIVEGYTRGVLKGEIAVHHKEKVYVNSVVTGVASLILMAMGVFWHPAFYLVSAFAAIVCGASIFMASNAKDSDETVEVSGAKTQSSSPPQVA